MRKLLAVVLSLMMIVMVGCSQNGAQEESELFTESVEKGKLAIAERDYTLASDMFKLALEEKEDEEVSKLKKQCDLMIEMEDILSNYEDIESKLSQYTEENFDELGDEINVIHDDFKKIVELCDEVLAIDTKSQIIIDMAKEVKLESEKSLKEFELALAEYEEIKEEEKKAQKVETKTKDQEAQVYKCIICGKNTTKYCVYDGCAPLCEDDQGYYCECGEFHHTQELCPVFDN